MADPTIAPDAAVPLPGSAAEVVAWRTGGQLHLTVVAKATFAFVPDAEMTRVEPQPILRAEVYHGNSPARSVRYGGDLAPHLGRADVLFTGSACAPPPGTAQSMYARLVVLGTERVLLDKRIVVQDARGFQRLPIVYEQAFGGPGVADNPLGVGEVEGSGVPVFYDPRDPRHPAGFGPIARAWPARRRLLGNTSRKDLDGPIAEIPAGFDWSYFQAAPLDQRTEYLRGDEWIMLEGLHPEHPLLRTRLPGARGVARIHGLSAFGVPEGHPLDLVADTLRIQGDDQRCTVVCRRSFPLPTEAALASVRVLAGVAAGTKPIDWPALPPAGAARAPAPAAAQGSGGATVALPAGEEGAGGAVLPFVTTSRPQGAPSAVPPAPAPPPGATIALAPSYDEAPLPPPLPFKPEAEPASPPAPPAPPVARVATGTLAISPDALLGSDGMLPFADTVPRPPQPVLPPLAEILLAAIPPSPIEPPASPEPLPARAAGPEVVPYFEPRAPEPEPAPRAPEPPPPEPEPDPAAFPLEKLASITAEIAEGRAPRDEVLRARGVEERVFREAERHWTAAIKKDATRGRGKLRSAYDTAYVEAVEGFRGPITGPEYARIVVAMERQQSDETLDALRIQKPALMSIVRLWTRKVAGDGRLYAEVNAAIAALRDE